MYYKIFAYLEKGSSRSPDDFYGIVTYVYLYTRAYKSAARCAARALDRLVNSTFYEAAAA